MPTVLPVALVDAVAADLAGVVQPKTTAKYVEPRVVEPDDCPLMSVWTTTTEFDLVVTPDQYERRIALHVDWHIAGTGEAEFGGIDDAVNLAQLETTAQLLLARLATYASGVPTFDSNTIATLVDYTPGPSEGVLWVARINLTVQSPQP